MPSLEFASVLLIAIGLSADCFAVALSGSVSIRTPSVSQVLRTSLAFGVSQAIMSVFGWLVGRTVIDLIAAYDHWVAFALLVIVGSRMIWESFRSSSYRRESVDITKGLSLLALSVATSIDALAVGLTFAFLEVNIALTSLTIGLVAFLVTSIGFILGSKMGKTVGKRAEAIGGIVLVAVGLRIVLGHVL